MRPKLARGLERDLSRDDHGIPFSPTLAQDHPIQSCGQEVTPLEYPLPAAKPAFSDTLLLVLLHLTATSSRRLKRRAAASRASIRIPIVSTPCSPLPNVWA